MTVEWSAEAFGESPPDPPTEDTLVLPLLSSMVDCLCEELAASYGPDPCFCGLVPAALVAMDFCDCGGISCGMAWVRLDSIYPSRRFADQTTDARCGDPLAVRINVGVTRCLPGPDARGNPPDAVAQAEAVAVQMADMAAMRRAVACCLPQSTKYVLGTYQPLGPSGNCGGGVWTVTVQVM